MLRVLVRKLKTFGALPNFIKLWFIPTWLLLGFAKMAIFCITFRRIAPLLGHSVGIDLWLPIASPAQQARALLIGRTVKMVAGYTPWVSNCFPQAVAARVLLGLYGVPYALYFGLMRDKTTRDMLAHAWVRSGRVSVTGGPGFANYTVVGMFVSESLALSPKP